MKPAPPSQYSDLSSQASPFSPSFDPNATNSHTAHTPQRLHPRLSASSLSSSAGSIHVAQEQWNQIMSASLSALANQFQNASRIIHSSGSEGTSGSRHPHDGGSASYGTSVSGDAEGAEDTISELALARATAGGVGMQGVETMLSLMMSRLENVERNQVRLGGEVERMRDELKELKEDMGTKVEPTPTVKSEGESGYFGTYNSEKAKMKGKEVKIEVEAEAGAEVRDTKDAEDWQKRVEALESKIESIQETIKVEQARLYPRLQNAFVTLNKQVIKPLPMQGTGKAPVNFPATKGEFEHVTKERYEQLLKAYGLPIKGDTAAKREAVREFIGLTQPGK